MADYKKIGKAVGVAAVLAALQAAAPFATELVASLPAPLVPIALTLLAYFVKSPVQPSK